MAKRVDFKLSKAWGLHEKGKVFSKMNRAQARFLQDTKKVGKILGESKTQKDLENEEAIKANLEAATEERVNAHKAEAETKVKKAEEKATKAEEALKAQKDKSSTEIADMKKKLTEAKKAENAALKAQKIAENKMDKLAKQRATK